VVDPKYLEGENADVKTVEIMVRTYPAEAFAGDFTWWLVLLLSMKNALSRFVTLQIQQPVWLIIFFYDEEFVARATRICFSF